MTTVRVFVKIVSIADEELFSETAVGCTGPYFVLIIWCSRWFCSPLPLSFEAVYCSICGHRRAAVARYRLFVLFLSQQKHMCNMNAIFWSNVIATLSFYKRRSKYKVEVKSKGQEFKMFAINRMVLPHRNTNMWYKNHILCSSKTMANFMFLLTVRQTDRRTVGQTDRRTDKQSDS